MLKTTLQRYTRDPRIYCLTHKCATPFRPYSFSRQYQARSRLVRTSLLLPETNMPKRKISSTVADQTALAEDLAATAGHTFTYEDAASPAKRRASRRQLPGVNRENTSTNPDQNSQVLDAPGALRASPDAQGPDERINLEKIGVNVEDQVKPDDDSDSPLSDIPDLEILSKSKGKKSATKAKDVKAAATPEKTKAKTSDPQDPEADEEVEADEEELKEAVRRPPPVNSDYLPLPWKGRLGYACLNTYLRFSNPPVFSSRTCRIASILENRHPLANPDEPPHATKNRPDKDQPASIERGQAFVEALGLANARDIVKMLRWNDRYGIKFLRLSSEMFPFASHEEYGYKLAPFASETLAEAGKVAAELGHRLTTHPGQFTQLGSPRKVVIDNAIRDLEYHAELLRLLKLPPQQNRDAVMILHLGGVFGDKEATLQRFRENYVKLDQDIKNRIVLENDDVCYTVHDLLPLCEELNIPMVLDFHHHNIMFDADKIREGTKDIMDLYPRILATWKRKNITPKMHYSEPTPAAITGRQRRKHNPRVATLPPCPPDMDLMIEAKDKEQAVFELMRTFKLPGFETINDIIPNVRDDDNKLVGTPKKKAPKKKSKKAKEEDEQSEMADEVAEPERPVIPDDEVGMGGPDGRVYWPPSMEEWLRPVKRVIKPKEPKDATPKTTPAKKGKAAAEAVDAAQKLKDEVDGEKPSGITDEKAPTARGTTSKAKKGGKKTATVPTPPSSESEASEAYPEAPSEEYRGRKPPRPPAPAQKSSVRVKKR